MGVEPPSSQPPHAPVVILLMGVSGVGKSTTGTGLSRRLGWTFRDADTFHPPANVAKMSAGTPLTDADRAPWLAAIAAWMDEETSAGRSAIVSCSALKRAYRDVLSAGRPGVRLVHLVAAQPVIAERLAGRRGHFMPSSLLQSQFDTLEPPSEDERPLIVSVRQPPRRVVAEIIERLGIRRSD